MPEGVFGTALMETAKVLADELPQALLADTEIVPPVIPVTAEIVLLVDVPVQPLGSVQVYELAPDTAGTE